MGDFMKIKVGCVVFATLLAVASSASADLVVVANNYAATPYAPATGLNTFIRDTGNPRTGQLLINQNQLGSMLPGDTITGMSFRLYNGAVSTYTGATWASYEIRLGEGVAPSAGSTTFANNFVGASTLVQSGPLTMTGFTSGALGATPNGWNDEIVFSTPYVYTGGHLVIEIRHGGSNIVNPANSFLEAVATTGLGYGTDYRSFTATGNAATVGAQATFTMTRLSFTAIPEPGSCSLMGLAGAAVLFVRRRIRQV